MVLPVRVFSEQDTTLDLVSHCGPHSEAAGHVGREVDLQGLQIPTSRLGHVVAERVLHLRLQGVFRGHGPVRDGVGGRLLPIL